MVFATEVCEPSWPANGKDPKHVVLESAFGESDKMTCMEIQCITSHDHKEVFHHVLCFYRGNSLCQTYSN